MTIRAALRQIASTVKVSSTGAVLDSFGLSVQKVHKEISEAIVNGAGFAALKPGFTETAFCTCSDLRRVPASLLKQLMFHTGIFPTTVEMLTLVQNRLRSNLQAADLLLLPTSFSGIGLLFNPNFKAKFARYQHGEPRGTSPRHPDSDDCWWYQLRERRVAVINPRASFLVKRYNLDIWNRVWKHRKSFVPFQLTAIDIPDATDESVRRQFETSEHLTAAIHGIIDARLAEFDIALVAAGHFALPICINLKSAGKVVIQMGGHLQLLFGVYGRRWESRKDWQAIINESWTRFPLELRPEGFEQQEGGCYF